MDGYKAEKGGGFTGAVEMKLVRHNWPAGKGSLNKHSFISGVLYLYKRQSSCSSMKQGHGKSLFNLCQITHAVCLLARHMYIALIRAYPLNQLMIYIYSCGKKNTTVLPFMIYICHSTLMLPAYI